MQTTQGRDRIPAHWHYADERGMDCGPYHAEAIVRLFQFGHIRMETPLWRDDPSAARPLRDCTETFEIGPGSRVRLAPPAPEPSPPAPAAAATAEVPAPTPDVVPPVAATRAVEPSIARTPAGRPWIRWVAAALLLAVTAVALRFAT